MKLMRGRISDAIHRLASGHSGQHAPKRGKLTTKALSEPPQSWKPEELISGWCSMASISIRVALHDP